MTAHAMVGDEKAFVDAGFDEYITKPLSIDALCEMLGRYVKLGSPGMG